MRADIKQIVDNDVLVRFIRNKCGWALFGEMVEISVHLLHNREDLLEPVAQLINEEWPRSLTARLLSISDGVDNLPCSVILTRMQEGGGEEVIGHARLMPVAGDCTAAFIETVVVARRLRGCGLGRRIMEEAELHAARRSYRSMHLSTHDKVGFYSHLGYVGGPKVSPLTKCMATFYLTNEKAQSLVEGLESGCTETGPISDASTEQHTQSPSPVPTTTVTPPTSALAPPPPPPPPPPPKLLESSQLKESETITWMMKHLPMKI